MEHGYALTLFLHPSVDAAVGDEARCSSIQLGLVALVPLLFHGDTAL